MAACRQTRSQTRSLHDAASFLSLPMYSKAPWEKNKKKCNRVRDAFKCLHKNGSEAKYIVNTFLASIIRKTSRAIVIDASTLGSARALAEHMPATNITVLNFDSTIVDQAKRVGFQGIAGTSTSSLARMVKDGVRDVDIIYLDYCGAPIAKKDWDPADDARIASRLLSDHGILAMTFCLRPLRERDIPGKIAAILPDDMEPVELYEYNESSKMYVSFSTFNYAERVRRRFNQVRFSVEGKDGLCLCSICHRSWECHEGHVGAHRPWAAYEADIMSSLPVFDQVETIPLSTLKNGHISSEDEDETMGR